MHAHAMNDADTREMLACVGDEARYLAVKALTDGGRCVTELARDIGRSQSCTTRHLQALRRGGIVRRERQGKRVVFTLRMEDPKVRSLVEWAMGRSPDRGPAAPRRQTRSGRPRRPSHTAVARSARRSGASRPPAAGTGASKPAGASAPTASPITTPTPAGDAGRGTLKTDPEPALEPASTGSGEPVRPPFDDLEDFLL